MHDVPPRIAGELAAQRLADLLRAPPPLQLLLYELPQHRVASQLVRPGPGAALRGHPRAVNGRYRPQPGSRLRRDRANSCYVGTVSLGYDAAGKRLRRTVRGKTKADVKAKLDTLHDEINAGISTPATYTVGRCVRDWLDALTLDPGTVASYRGQAERNGSIPRSARPSSSRGTAGTPDNRRSRLFVPQHGTCSRGNTSPALRSSPGAERERGTPWVLMTVREW